MDQSAAGVSKQWSTGTGYSRRACGPGEDCQRTHHAASTMGRRANQRVIFVTISLSSDLELGLDANGVTVRRVADRTPAGAPDCRRPDTWPLPPLSVYYAVRRCPVSDDGPGDLGLRGVLSFRNAARAHLCA